MLSSWNEPFPYINIAKDGKRSRIYIEDRMIEEGLDKDALVYERAYARNECIPFPPNKFVEWEPGIEKRGEGFKESDINRTMTSELIGKIFGIDYPVAIKGKESSKSSSCMAIEGLLHQGYPGCYDLCFRGYGLHSNGSLINGTRPVYCNFSVRGVYKRNLSGNWVELTDGCGMVGSSFYISNNQLLDESKKVIKRNLIDFKLFEK